MVTEKNSIDFVKKFLNKCNSKDLLNLYYELVNNEFKNLNIEIRKYFISEFEKEHKDLIKRGY